MNNFIPFTWVWVVPLKDKLFGGLRRARADKCWCQPKVRTTKLSQGLRELTGTAVSVGIRMAAGFYCDITTRGRVEGRCQKKFCEEIHVEKLPSANQNHKLQSQLHFSHRKKWRQPHNRRCSGVRYGTQHMIWDFLLTTVFGRYHYPYCTGEETEVYRGWETCPSSYGQFISELGFKPKQKCALRPHSIYSPGLYSQVYKRQVWAIERTEKSISLGKEKFKNPCCLSPNSTQSGRRISSEGQQVIHSPSIPSEANKQEGWSCK